MTYKTIYIYTTCLKWFGKASRHAPSQALATLQYGKGVIVTRRYGLDALQNGRRRLLVEAVAIAQPATYNNTCATRPSSLHCSQRP